MKFQLLIKPTIVKNKTFLAFKHSDVVFIMLVNVKMPTVVGILTFMSMIKVMLSCVEHEKSPLTSGPGYIVTYFILTLFKEENTFSDTR